MREKMLIERVSHLVHNMWASWMQYVFSKCLRQPDGTYLIPKWAVERWQRQIETPYNKLPDDEKSSDKIEAKKFIALFAKQIERFLSS